MEELEPITPTEDMKNYLQTIENGVLDGHLDALEVYVKIKHYQKLLAKVEKTIYGHAKDEADKRTEKTFVLYGCEVQKKSPAPRPDYTEDAKYKEIQNWADKASKARKALLDAALKTTDPIFDNEGIEVPKVALKGVADSLTIKPPK